MTSLTRELGRRQDISAFMDVVCAEFATTYARRAVEIRPVELGPLAEDLAPSAEERRRAAAA
jgi:hypothetical protein